MQISAQISAIGTSMRRGTYAPRSSEPSSVSVGMLGYGQMLQHTYHNSPVAAVDFRAPSGPMYCKKCRVLASFCN